MERLGEMRGAPLKVNRKHPITALAKGPPKLRWTVLPADMSLTRSTPKFFSIVFLSPEVSLSMEIVRHLQWSLGSQLSYPEFDSEVIPLCANQELSIEQRKAKIADFISVCWIWTWDAQLTSDRTDNSAV